MSVNLRNRDQVNKNRYREIKFEIKKRLIYMKSNYPSVSRHHQICKLTIIFFTFINLLAAQGANDFQIIKKRYKQFLPDSRQKVENIKQLLITQEKDGSWHSIPRVNYLYQKQHIKFKWQDPAC